MLQQEEATYPARWRCPSSGGEESGGDNMSRSQSKIALQSRNSESLHPGVLIRASFDDDSCVETETIVSTRPRRLRWEMSRSVGVMGHDRWFSCGLNVGRHLISYTTADVETLSLCSSQRLFVIVKCHDQTQPHPNVT